MKYSKNKFILILISLLIVSVTSVVVFGSMLNAETTDNAPESIVENTSIVPATRTFVDTEGNTKLLSLKETKPLSNGSTASIYTDTLSNEYKFDSSGELLSVIIAPTTTYYSPDQIATNASIDEADASENTGGVI